MQASATTTTTTKWKQSSSSPSTIPLIAGLLGGAVSTIALYPLDLVKVKLQVNVGEGNSRRRLTSMAAIRGIVRHEGFLGLYQGLSPAVIGSAISWGGYFFVYEELKRRYAFYKQSQQYQQQDPMIIKDYNFNALEHFSLSCLAGSVMVALTNPIWLIKTRMQLQMNRTSANLGIERPYNGMLDAAKTIIRQEGPFALYKGVVPALMLTTHGGVQFMCYEYLRRYFHYTRPKRDDSSTTRQSISVMERLYLSMGYLTMGAISKIFASTSTYPLQVLKSRLQQRAQSIEMTLTGDVKVVRRDYAGGITKTIQNIVQKEGISAFFKGCIPNALRVAPSAAITFVVYETVLDALSKHDE